MRSGRSILCGVDRCHHGGCNQSWFQELLAVHSERSVSLSSLCRQWRAICVSSRCVHSGSCLGLVVSPLPCSMEGAESFVEWAEADYAWLREVL